MSTIKRNSKMNSSEEAYQAMLDDIVSGGLRPGLIVSEHDLSQKYGIGRTPIREAIRRLEGEGFIVVSDKKRRVYYLTSDDIQQIFDLKIVIEGMIAYRAAESDDSSLRGRLQEVLEEMKKFGSGEASSEGLSVEKWLELDKEFHILLYHMARNTRAMTIIDNLNMQWHWIRVGMSAVTGHLERSTAEHLKIGNAVLGHDPETARDAIKEHFENLKKIITSLMNTFGN